MIYRLYRMGAVAAGKNRKRNGAQFVSVLYANVGVTLPASTPIAYFAIKKQKNKF